MTDDQPVSLSDVNIIDAINKAKPGITKYLNIMALLYGCDVASDVAFQTAYNGFYRVRQKSPAWYVAYFNVMEQNKGRCPTFAFVLDALRVQIGNNAYEPSFASKLVASLDPWAPIWDEFVLRNTGHKPPAYTAKSKHADAVTAHASIVAWYETFLNTDQGRHWIQLFNESVPAYYRMTDIKKVDFILWQTRG